ncbi:MAG TPA: dihydroneopterin aldolase [bacterium]|nr:dihydroneopterin aldolase [bacterium]
MPDHVLLSGMRFHTRHGVLGEERTQGQDFLVDVDVEADLGGAGQSDDLQRTIDYRRVYGIVTEVMLGAPQNLIETLAEMIATKILVLDRISAVTVRVRKPQVKLPGPLESAGVEIRREK